MLICQVVDLCFSIGKHRGIGKDDLHKTHGTLGTKDLANTEICDSNIQAI